ncbi:MAG: metallophosphoesterase [Myxococcales bacterium]|nr:MAG: metallophosphoesterase [Myxococcales bacterium]
MTPPRPSCDARLLELPRRVVSLLHISDLHVTAPNTSLGQIWIAVDAALRKERTRTFDFIVVSGDLTQQAERKEYEALQEFTRATLLPLTKNQQKARIIFVPGNHDVSWASDGWTLQPFSAFGDGELKEMLTKYKRNPLGSDFRLHVSALGHLELRRKSEKYPERLSEAQRFLNEFYDDSPPGDEQRRFKLLEDENDWSAHIFPEEGIAFYGFNSCWGNDQFWTGAHIDPRSISRAANHANEHAKDMLRIAVWHHGLTSDSQRPDYLATLTLGYLRSAGFQLGLHGHTHKAELESLTDVLGDAFAVVATGSLGAGHAERPDAVGNQFTIGKLFAPSHGRFQCFDRDGGNGSYKPKRAWRVTLGAPSNEEGKRSSCTLHTRVCHVGEDGLAHVWVHLEDVHIASSIVLAHMSQPFAGVRGDLEAETNLGNVPVHRNDLADGCVRFVIYGDGSYTRLSWSYGVSNGFALSQADIERRPLESAKWDPILENGEQAWHHRVRFDAERVTYGIHFKGKPSPNIHAVTALAEVDEQDSTSTDRSRRRDEREQRRVQTVSDEDMVGMVVDGPVVGHRYAAAYRLGTAGTLANQSVQSFIDDLVKTRRTDMTRAEAEIDVEQAVAQRVNQILGAKPVSWVCFLWNSELRRLQPAFGVFPPQTWGRQFKCGHGVAGHSFRFSRVAAWHHDPGDPGRTIIYERLNGSREHDWIVCIPLRTGTGRDAPSVGVFSFSGYDFESGSGRQLAVAAKTGKADKNNALISRLMHGLHGAFWSACRQSALVESHRGVGEEIDAILG